jgi:Skp family chaperone for outer membrane proteins
MKRSVFALGLIGVAGIAGWGWAQNSGQSQSTEPSAGLAARSGAGPIVVVDLVRIFNECEQIKDLNESIRKKTEEVNQEAAQRKKVIDEKRDLLSAFQPGSSDHEGRRKDLVRLNVEANVWLKLAEEDMDNQKFVWTRIIYEKAVKAATDLAQQRGYLAVVQRVEFKPDEVEPNVQALRRMIQERTVIYNLPEIDITEAIIRRLDAEYKAAGGKRQLDPSSRQPQPKE